jgi:hypothetical protein
LYDQSTQPKLGAKAAKQREGGGGWDIDPKLEYGTKPFLHERIGLLARAEGIKAKTKPLPKSLRYGFG